MRTIKDGTTTASRSEPPLKQRATTVDGYWANCGTNSRSVRQRHHACKRPCGRPLAERWATSVLSSLVWIQIVHDGQSAYCCRSQGGGQ